MAVNVALLFVLEAIAEVNVKMVEIPKLPKSKTTENKLMFSTGLPSSTLKSKSVKAAITNCKIALNSIFERIMACGFAIE